MEHIEIEKKINKIRESMIAELKKANAIDDNGNATNRAEFEKIMDRAIQQVNEMEPMIADESGVARDRNSSNIFYHNLQILNEMRDRGNVGRNNDSYSLRRGEQNEEKMLGGRNLRPVFEKGADLVKKLQMRFKQRTNGQILQKSVEQRS